VTSVPKWTEPKSARGSTPPLDEGASAIHSAEDLCAELTLEDVEKLWPVVRSVIVTLNLVPKFTAAEIVSPGCTVMELIRKEA
jgi:hypothetical protein